MNDNKVISLKQPNLKEEFIKIYKSISKIQELVVHLPKHPDLIQRILQLNMKAQQRTKKLRDRYQKLALNKKRKTQVHYLPNPSKDK